MHQLCRAFVLAKRIAAGLIQIGQPLVLKQQKQESLTCFYTVLFNGSKDAGRREISVNSKKDADVRFALTGQWLKSITFHLPIIDGEMKIPVNNGLDKNAHVETVRCNI